MLENSDKPLGEPAAKMGVCTLHFSRVLRLSCVAPRHRQGRTPESPSLDLNAEHLAKRPICPFDWDEQQKLFGLD